MRRKKGELERQLEDLLRHRTQGEQIEYIIGVLAAHVYLGAVGKLPPNHVERVERILDSYVETYDGCGAIVRGIRESMGEDLRVLEAMRKMRAWEKEPMFG